MKELEIKYRQDKDYRELFSIMIDSHICEDTAIGIKSRAPKSYSVQVRFLTAESMRLKSKEPIKPSMRSTILSVQRLPMDPM